jgi:hypothetical protein
MGVAIWQALQLESTKVCQLLYNIIELLFHIDRFGSLLNVIYPNSLGKRAILG